MQTVNACILVATAKLEVGRNASSTLSNVRIAGLDLLQCSFQSRNLVAKGLFSEVKKCHSGEDQHSTTSTSGEWSRIDISGCFGTVSRYFNVHSYTIPDLKRIGFEVLTNQSA